MIRGSFGHQLISASAGSGKTHQLTNCYIRILAAGVEPNAILATTFTRKAAGEILDRVLERLARAAGSVEAARDLAVHIQAPERTQQDFVSHLRTMLRNLHRVRIGTLDSFYIALAGSFSLELGLPAGWAICEQVEDDVLREEALERLLEGEEAEILLALYKRLTKRQTKRGVHEELRRIVTDLYAVYQDTAPEVWKKVAVTQRMLAGEFDDLLARMEAFDLSENSRMQKPLLEDLQRARSEKWKELLSKGLSAKVFSGEHAFHAKPIPEELIALYQNLIRQVQSALIELLGEQTAATREFLDRFHGELWSLKQASGKLRFGDVTQALVDAFERKALRMDPLAFRLDGAVEHLLLDEFQDTSLAQWRVLDPIARRITQAPADSPRSFFCVGDVKQAIYGWRGGVSEILNRLPRMLGKLQESSLVESWRSARAIIDTVNTVFGNLGRCQAGDKCQEGLAVWGRRFDQHQTRKAEQGYVCLQTGPAQRDGQSLADHRGEHCKAVAERIAELAKRIPASSIGVLCRQNSRQNPTVGRMIYELRKCGIDASEEGGTELTDSPAVELILSLFVLADHPGHSVAWFHLQNSPLKEELQSFADADTLAKHLRRELLTIGYGRFVYEWAKRLALASACDKRDLSRLQQLVETAYAYQPRSTPRADDFVTWVRQERALAPSGDNVRVMTIHAAKGLQFDVVFLPELDVSLAGQPPAFVVRRDSNSLDPDFVCRYADETVQSLLTPEERRAFEEDRQHRVEESLSLLYVAMTRAIHALYMYIPGPRKFFHKDAWYNLLRQTLAPETTWEGCSLLFKHGDANWFEDPEDKTVRAPTQGPELPQRIAFQIGATDRRRGLEQVAPSRREGQARVVLDRLFKSAEATARAAGTLYHAWFATIGWLDDGMPVDTELRAVAEKLRADLPGEIWRDLDQLLANFRTWLENSVINGVLQRSAYADPEQSGFPGKLAPFWTKTTRPREVQQERRFLVLDGAKLWNGSFDRVVWLGDGDQIVAADVLDFKTDAILPGDAAALAERIEHYRPQLEAYHYAAARLAHLPAECVATRLVFTTAGRVVNVG